MYIFAIKKYIKKQCKIKEMMLKIDKNIEKNRKKDIILYIL